MSLHSAFILYKLLERKNLNVDIGAIGMTFTNIDAGDFSFNTASSAPPPHVISFIEGS